MKWNDFSDYASGFIGIAAAIIITDLITTTKNHLSRTKELEEASSIVTNTFKKGIDADEK